MRDFAECWHVHYELPFLLWHALSKRKTNAEPDASFISDRSYKM